MLRNRTKSRQFPSFLRLVDIKGAIITIDAMGTQKAIAAQIIEGEADYVLALKGNQETLHQAVIDYIDEQLEGDLANAREHVTTEKGHGREETRTYLQLPAPKSLPGFTLWKGLMSIGMVTSRCVRDGKETDRGPLLHQQSGHGREAIRPSRPGSLGYRKYLPLGSRYDVSRGRVADPRTSAAGELCLAQSLHFVTAEAASRPHEPRHETPQLWLERKLPAGSPCWSNGLVGAGPAAEPPLAEQHVCHRSKEPRHIKLIIFSDVLGGCNSSSHHETHRASI